MTMTLSDVLTIAERDGIKLALRGRLLILLTIAAWYLISRSYPVAINMLLLISLLILIGFLQSWLVSSRFDRPWLRYAFILFDVMVLITAIMFAPISLGDDIPQIFVFRISVFPFLFLVLAIVSLSLSPSLVIWTTVILMTGWLAGFGWIIAGMDETLGWADMDRTPTLNDYLTVFLNPNFIGAGSRMQEAVVLLITGLLISLAVRRARRLVYNYHSAEQERRTVADLFGRYVPEQVVQSLLRESGSLEPQQRIASVLFIDLERFTTLAETMPPDEIMRLLNLYFETINIIVAKHHGAVLQFQGDGMLASFNAPADDPQHAQHAIAAAQELLDTVAKTQFFGHRLNIRVGICTGPLAAGTVGGGGRQSYNIIGDTVNTAARLEALNKSCGTRLLVSQATVAAAGAEFDFKPVGEFSVKGKSQPVVAYTLESAHKE